MYSLLIFTQKLKLNVQYATLCRNLLKIYPQISLKSHTYLEIIQKDKFVKFEIETLLKKLH